jgi:hypothetical protein
VLTALTAAQLGPVSGPSSPRPRAGLRAVIEEHRARGQDAATLSGLTVQIDQLRRSLEVVSANVRRLERARRKPR